MAKYWITRLSDEYWFAQALEKGIWCTQQRYGQQATQTVTTMWKTLAQIRPGDIMLLTYANGVHAYGVVEKCPYESAQIDSIEHTLKHRSHKFNTGLVRFSDSDVVFDDLRTATDHWGERVSVGHWQCYCDPTNVSTSGMKEHATPGSVQLSLIGIDEAFGKKLKKELELQYNNRNMETGKIASLLKSKKNVILQGAPGTGKTYATAAVALCVLGQTDIDLSDHAAVMKRYDELLDKQIFFTTFHQSLDYEDFIEGLKPVVQRDDTGNAIGVSYEPKDGIFKQACAAVDTDKPVVLIIDEINRGNVSKIFGELITLIEADKRIGASHPVKAKLPYSGDLFGVPDNLYIIGTMNTTDRSTGTLDYALRRRFAFVTLEADRKALEKYYADDASTGAKALALFDDVKAFISDKKYLAGDCDIADLMPGHSYFMAKSEEDLQLKMEYELIPLIAEYISDGLLNISADDKKAAFAAWGKLEIRK